jgi:chromosomal replication initiator protein
VTTWLSTKLRPLIAKTLGGLLDHPVDVEFTVVNTDDTGIDQPLALAATQEPRTPAAPRVMAAPQPRFNSKYTLESFIVGKGNRLAHAAAYAVAMQPGEAYNPLFLYGGVGLGKTHLLHAVGQCALTAGLHVTYVSSEQFTNEFVNSIRERRAEEFRGKYRSTDVLLIDDIQFISGKEQTQEEFFHTFNDLHAAGKQIILTSDRSPKLISRLEDRLRSRFEWGLIADIEPPDLETRLAILRTKSDEQRVAVPEEVLALLAQRVQDNVRELEGLLNRVVALARLLRSPVTLDLASEALAGITPQQESRPPTSSEVLMTVCEYFRVTMDELRGKSREKRLAHARQVAMYFLRDSAQLPLSEIGHLLGGRDHTTVLHGHGKVQQSFGSDPQVRHDVLVVRENLAQSRRDASQERSLQRLA